LDPITHVIAGGLAGAAALPNAPWEGIAISATAALLPDLDFVLYYINKEKSQDLHRGPTHSLLGLVVLTALVGAAAWLILGWQFWAAAGVAAIGLGSHLFLDFVLHGVGLELFWPLSTKRFSANLIMGLNPRVSSIACHRKSTLVCLMCQLHIDAFAPHSYLLLAGTAGMFIVPDWRHQIALVTAILFGAYLLLTLGFKLVAGRRMSLLIGARVGLGHIYPASSLPWGWVGVARRNGKVLTGTVGIGSDKVMEHVPAQGELVTRAMATDAGRFLLKVGLEPAAWVEQSDGHTTVHLEDLSHYGVVPEELFSARVVFDAEGRIIAGEFREKWIKGAPGPCPVNSD
jgi:membrane-bound metal-dependent hydrolase YbcI (DUF457 family)